MGTHRPLIRRFRTAASLPGRVVAVEDRLAPIEAEVTRSLTEMRQELAEMRLILRSIIEADADSTALLGRILATSEARLEALEDLVHISGGSTAKP